MGLHYLSFGDVGNILTAIFTAIYTIGTFLLWISTRKTTKLLARELQNQVASNASTAHHNVLDAHRNLYLDIIRDSCLLKILASSMGVNEDEARSKFLGTLLINHTLRIFWDYKNNLADARSLDSFQRDVSDMFSFPFVRKRWEEVKKFHPPEFQIFIDNALV